jgi:hypothetical protein
MPPADAMIALTGPVRIVLRIVVADRQARDVAWKINPGDRKKGTPT